jgi:hypothetical protein
VSVRGRAPQSHHTWWWLVWVCVPVARGAADSVATPAALWLLNAAACAAADGRPRARAAAMCGAAPSLSSDKGRRARPNSS